MSYDCIGIKIHRIIENVNEIAKLAVSSIRLTQCALKAILEKPTCVMEAAL